MQVGAAGIITGDPGGQCAARPLDSAECYARLGRALRGYLRQWVPADDVADVVQTALLDLWRTRDRFDPARSLDAWALMIARRRAIDYLRSRPCPATLLSALPEPPGDDGRAIAARIADAAQLESTLAALPEAQREAIQLAYYGGLSQREIADRLRVPVGTIKARTARGLVRARQLLVTAEGAGLADGRVEP